MTKILMPEIAKGVQAGAIDSVMHARNAGTNIAIWENGKATEKQLKDMKLEDIGYKNFMITVFRLDSARWIVNLSSDVASLMSKLEQPNMVFSDPDRDLAIEKAKKYVDEVLK